MSVNMRNKVPETCRYWRMNKCIKGKHQCNYVHGFICVNDGRCWRENCSNWHFRQKRGGRGDHYGKSHQNYQKMHRNRHPRSRSRSMSPRWHHKGGHRMRSPPRRRSRSRSPPSWRSRSRSPPPRRSRSRSSHPRRSRSRSPPPRRSRSHSYPSRRSRSRSYSFPSRRSKSRTPASRRSRSRSSPRGTRSPCPSHHRSRSHSPFEHRSRSRSRRMSQSPSRRSRSPSVSHNKSRSRSPANQRSGSFNSGERKSRSPSLPRQRNRSGTMSSFDSENYNANQEQRDGFERSQHTGNIRSNNNSYSSSPLSNCPPMHKNRSGTQEQVSRQEAMRPDVPISEQMKIAADQDQKERTSIVELQERITRDLMDPHTQNLLKELLKQSKKTAEEKESPRKDVSPDPAVVASELEELGMDLEEVGEEVDDIFGKSISRSVEDSIGNSFQEGLERGKRLRQVQASTNPSPPSRERGHEPKSSSRGQDTRYPSDWNLKSTMEDPRKHLHSSLQSSEEPTVKSVPDDAKSSGSSFWVPAFDWHKAQKVKKDMSYQSGANDWEVETPYVQRKEKMGERQTAHPTLKETKQMVPPTAMSSSSSSSSRLPPVPAMTSQLDEEATASRITELNKDKVPQSRPMLFPSGHSYSPSVPPPSSQTRAHSSRSAIPSPGDEAADDHEPPVQVRSKSKRQKTGKSKQRRSYDSGSDSSAEDKKTSKMHEREVKELEDPVQKLMQKRETLLKRARSLTEQKDLMMNQREDIISNHKGDKSSLNNLLQENWFLVKEMGNQITKINHMVIEVEKEIEVLKPGNQPLPRAESPQRRRSRSPPAMRFCGPSRQYEHGKTPERNYKHVEASYRNESKGYEYPEHRRSVSPASGKHRSRSPAAAGPHRISSPAARQQRSRSPNVSRHKSRSPNAGRHRTRSPVSGGQQQRLWSPSGEYSKEFQRAPSTSRKRTTAGKPDGEKRQQDMYRKKEEPKEEIDEGLQYPQGFVQRTYIRYCDQGMHWCKLCSIFCESIPEYVDHLLSSSHLAKCKYDRKTWLAKAPKEEKEPKPPNATALIVPVQGVEFLHSLTSYYCSLCDVFMRDKGEAVRHPESKIHTSNYKMHLVKNPMYEASLVKTKAAAYAKYSVEQARYMVEAKMKLKEKIATDEIEEKLLRQIKQKRDMVRQEKEESTEINEKVEKERSQRQESKKEKSEKREREKKVVESDSGRTLDHKNESSVTQTQASESKEYKDTSTRSESKKEKGSSREVVTKDLKTEGDEAAFADGSYKDSQDDEKKSATPKLPLIGKMPFLKKKQQSSVPKRKESSKETKQDIAASSNLVLDPKMEIPLTEDEQKIDLSDNIAWVMSQENENLIENVADPKTIAENEYPVVSDMDVCPLTSDYTGYEEQSGEVTNQDEEEYSCLDDLNTSECMDIEDDEPTECAAAATLKALDLLSIPLPGFKSANKTPLPSDIPLPPKTDEASKNQDNCDLPLPPGEESYPVTHFEMDNDSQEILAAANMIHDVHRDCGSGSNSQDSFPMVGLVSQGGSDMPVPPGTESVVSSDLQVPLLTAEVGSDLPLPPGTESMMGPSLPLPPGTENIISPDVLPPGTEHVMDPGLPLPPGTEDIGVPCLPLPPGAEDPLSSDLPLPPGTEDVAIASLPLPPGTEDTITSDLPLPPGTEDEAHMLVGSGLGVPSTKSKTVHLQDIAQKSKLGSDMTVPGTHFGAQELSSGAWSSGSNSQDGFGLPAFMTGMHENPIPPPPGTEDEHDLHASMNVLPPMGIRDNIASQFASEKALTASQTTTVCMSSFTAPKLGLHTQNALWSTSSNPEGLEHAGTTWPTDPSAVMDMPTRKSHIDREFTPPPPGTEMDDLNKSDSHPELGEASMELSDESDEECLQEKKESTPPPPGTESSSESMAISESKSGKSIISTLELSTRLDTKIRDPSLSVDFNAQSLDTQVNLPQSKKEESIKSTENIADSLNLSNVNVSKIGKRSCSTEDKEREKKFSEKAKVNKAKDKVDDERMQTEGNMSKEQGPPQQSQKAPRIGKPSKKESEEVEHGKEGRQESESKGKQRKTSRRSRDSTEEPQYLQPVEEESEFPEVKSSTPKKSTRTGKTEKSEEEVELEAKINEESSTKHRKASKKTKERRESVDDLKLAADTDASASQEETQTMKKSSRSGRSTKKDKDENDQDVPVKETKQRKRSTRSSSDDQPSEKGSSTPRRKSRSVRATIPEEREEDLESVLSPQEMSENADESEKANSSDVEDEQETDSETVPQQRTRAVRRLVSEDQTYEALSPRKRSRKSKPSVSEEEEPPPRRSTRTTRASITE